MVIEADKCPRIGASRFRSTCQPQPTLREVIGQVIAFIETLDLHNGTENALISKLESARDSLDRGNTGAAIN